MCNFASFVLTMLSEFWGPSESHESIIEHHKIHADGARGPNILRVEISPPEDNPRAPLEQWIYKVDQDVLPEWYDVDICEQRARAALLRRSQQEAWFAIAEGSKVSGGYASVITAGDYGTATAGEVGTATAGDYGTATAGDSGTATAGDYGTATAGHHGTATAGNHGSVAFRWWDTSSERYRLVCADIGEKGIEAGKPYYVVDGKIVEKLP